jgi:hypothetical protein
MKKMNLSTRKTCFSVGLLCFLFMGQTALLSQSSTHFRIKKDVISTTGRQSSAVSYSLYDVAGQPGVVGSMQSDHFRCQNGFLTGGDQAGTTFWADVDQDGDVDIVDIQLVAARWGARAGDPLYDARYDVDNEGQGDGDIDIVDIQLVASWWNQTLPQVFKADAQEKEDQHAVK